MVSPPRPQDLQNWVGIVPMGANLCPQFRSKTQGKNMHCLWNPIIKQSSFSQKMIILMSLPGVVSTPQDPQNWVGMVPLGAKFHPQVPFMTRGNKLTYLWNLWVKRSSFCQKMVVLASLPGVVLYPPGPPKFDGDGSYGCQILHTSPL